ncbi:MAG: hypothetical protein AAGJ32_02130 [Pseudomonadota bacterium]
MKDFIFFMHNDPAMPIDETAWGAYLAGLRASGAFEGGSEIGGGTCFRQSAAPAPLSDHLSGFLRLSAETLEDAQSFLAGNPVYEAGGTIEIRELPKT